MQRTISNVRGAQSLSNDAVPPVVYNPNAQNNTNSKATTIAKDREQVLVDSINQHIHQLIRAAKIGFFAVFGGAGVGLVLAVFGLPLQEVILVIGIPGFLGSFFMARRTAQHQAEMQSQRKELDQLRQSGDGR